MTPGGGKQSIHTRQFFLEEVLFITTETSRPITIIFYHASVLRCYCMGLLPDT